jgi:predicted CoA-binding protein
VSARLALVARVWYLPRVTHQNPPDAIIRQMLEDAKTIAVVGASSDPTRPSHAIFAQLLTYGYRVVPVNPNEKSVLGHDAFPTLADVPFEIDIVNVFRRSEHTLEVAEAAVAAGAKVLWLQSGIYNEAAAERAKAAGLVVVMDACIKVLHSVLRVRRHPPIQPRPIHL